MSTFKEQFQQLYQDNNRFGDYIHDAAALASIEAIVQGMQDEAFKAMLQDAISIVREELGQTELEV